ncbi:MAG: hypothetical protein ACJ79D_16255 [Myxococcales bacterium]
MLAGAAEKWTDPGHRLWDVLLLIAAATNVVALWSAPYLPFTDLPQHAAAIATLRHFDDAAWKSREYFTLALGRSQYLLYYLAGALLAFPFGTAERANLVLLSISAVAFPYALRSLLRTMGADPRLALFAVPLFWSQSLLIGFFNYVAALPLLLWALGLSVQEAAAPRAARTALLAAVSVALFYLHLSAFLLFAPAAALAQVLLAPHGLRAVARRFVWMVPTLGLGVAFLLTSPVVHPQAVGWNEPVNVWFEPVRDALQKLPEALLDIWPGDVDLWISLGLLGAAVLLVGPRDLRNEGARRRFVLAATWTAMAVALYFAFPISIGWLWQLNERYAIAATLLLPLLLAPRRGTRGAVPLLAVFLLGLASAGLAGRQARAFSREVDGFDRVISRAQPGRRLLGLVYERGSRAAKFAPYLHFGSYYRARGGGIAAFSFAELPQSPLRYRPETEPPRHPLHWEWEPWRFDRVVDGNYYDYVLVRGNVDPFARPGPGPRYRRIAHEGLWALYAKE